MSQAGAPPTQVIHTDIPDAPSHRLSRPPLPRHPCSSHPSPRSSNRHSHHRHRHHQPCRQQSRQRPSLPPAPPASPSWHHTEQRAEEAHLSEIRDGRQGWCESSLSGTGHGALTFLPSVLGVLDQGVFDVVLLLRSLLLSQIGHTGAQGGLDRTSTTGALHAKQKRELPTPAHTAPQTAVLAPLIPSVCLLACAYLPRT